MSATVVRPEGRVYETVAAGVTAQVLGTVGALGDVLDGLLVIPAATTLGVVTVLDGATSIPLYVGGTVGAALQPFYLDMRNSKSVSGPWKVTTGAGLSVIAFGRFS